MTVAPYKDPQFATREWLWIVFDNLHALGRVDEHFEFRAKKNRLLGTMELDSQFEVGRHMLSSKSPLCYNTTYNMLITCL